MYRLMFLASMFAFASSANADVPRPPPVVAAAVAAYKVLYPSGGDDYPAISAALANSATQPVQLALDPAHASRKFSISHGLTIPDGGTLKCENGADNNGNEGQVIISPTSTFVGSAAITTSGNDARVIGCSVYGGSAPAGVDCFAMTGNASVFDDIHANYCTGIGLNLTSHSGNSVFPRLIGHSSFYNSVRNAIAVHWDPAGSVSDIWLEGAAVGTNCTGGCNGEADVYIFASNGFVRGMRIEWSWNSGFWCDGCNLNFTDNFFDRPGGAAIRITGSASLNIVGNLIEGANRAADPQYSGPAIVLDQDQWGHVPSVRITGTAIQQWSGGASYFQLLHGFAGASVIEVDGSGIQPDPFGIYQDQHTHDILVRYVLAPPAYPQ